MKVWELRNALAGQDENIEVVVELHDNSKERHRFSDFLVGRRFTNNNRALFTIYVPDSVQMFEDLRRDTINNRACPDCRELSYKAAGAEARVAELEEEVKLNDERVLAKYGKKP